MNDHLETRMKRVETTLYGSDDSPERGLVTRVNMTHSELAQIQDLGKKIFYTVILGIVVALLNLVINGSQARSVVLPPAGGNSTVSIGAKTTSDSVSHRETLTTEEVAAREKVTPRTVTNWIASGRIDPPPSKDGKSWAISANYRLSPPNAESCGNSLASDSQP